MDKETEKIMKLNEMLKAEKEDYKRKYESKKEICTYQENIINKLLNTIQNHKLEVDMDIERGYKWD